MTIAEAVKRQAEMMCGGTAEIHHPACAVLVANQKREAPLCFMCKAPALVGRGTEGWCEKCLHASGNAWRIQPAKCICPASAAIHLEECPQGPLPACPCGGADYAGSIHVEGCPTIPGTVNRKRKADVYRLPPSNPLIEVSRDGKTWERRSMGENFGDVRFMRKDGVLEAVRNCRNVITRSGEHGFDFQRRLVELEAEDDAPIITGPEYRDPPLSAYGERSAGIKALTLPEARPHFVSSVGDYDLLADP